MRRAVAALCALASCTPACLSFHVLPNHLLFRAKAPAEAPPDAPGPKVSAIILPGFGVAPERYADVARSLRDQLGQRNVSASVYVLRYTADALSQFQAEGRVAEILRESDRAVLVGHSQGAYLASGMAGRLEGLLGNSSSPLPVVNWAGGSYTTPRPSSLTILCQLDRHYPCLKAVHADMGCSRGLVTIPHAGHFYGVGDESRDAARVRKEARAVARVIADYTGEAVLNDPRAGARQDRRVRKTTAAFSGFVGAKSAPSVAAWVRRRQGDVEGQEGGGTRRVVHHHSPRTSFLGTLATAAFPWLAVPMHASYYFPKFVFSHPTETTVHSYAPCTTLGTLGSLLLRNLPEASCWVKLKRGASGEIITAQALNGRTFLEAYESLTEEQRRHYDERGRQLVFGEDIFTRSGLEWVLRPISMDARDPHVTVFRSPVLVTDPGPGVYDGRFNAKLLSVQRALEWLLVDSFLP